MLFNKRPVTPDELSQMRAFWGGVAQWFHRKLFPTKARDKFWVDHELEVDVARKLRVNLAALRESEMTTVPVTTEMLMLFGADTVKVQLDPLHGDIYVTFVEGEQWRYLGSLSYANEGVDR